jgi:hypothetical protein
MAGGDAKLSGRAVEVTDQETFDRFVGQEREEKGEEPPQPSISSGSTSTRSSAPPSAATHPTTSSSRHGASAAACHASNAADPIKTSRTPAASTGSFGRRVS